MKIIGEIIDFKKLRGLKAILKITEILKNRNYSEKSEDVCKRR